MCKNKQLARTLSRILAEIIRTQMRDDEQDAKMCCECVCEFAQHQSYAVRLSHSQCERTAEFENRSPQHHTPNALLDDISQQI